MFDCENAWAIVRANKRIARRDWPNVQFGRKKGNSTEWTFLDGSRMVAGPTHLRGYGNAHFFTKTVLFSDDSTSYARD